MPKRNGDPEKSEVVERIGSVRQGRGVPEKVQAGLGGVVWSIAGFDPSNGAGVTADLMTFAAHGLFGCSAITALTVQSTRGVFRSEPVATSLLRETLARLAEDLPPVGVKIGMLGSPEIAEVVAEFLAGLGEQRPVVVLDPVLRSSSGRELFPGAALGSLHEHLLPVVDWVTPNWQELEVLTGLPVRDAAGATGALGALGARHPHLSMVATGGELAEPEDLLRVPGREPQRLAGRHVRTNSTHGTGCAFSSALLAQMVLGAGPEQAVRGAKVFVEGALRAAPGLGSGRGPMGLLWPLRAGPTDGS